jgi:hypothetical protein
VDAFDVRCIDTGIAEECFKGKAAIEKAEEGIFIAESTEGG